MMEHSINSMNCPAVAIIIMLVSIAILPASLAQDSTEKDISKLSNEELITKAKGDTQFAVQNWNSFSESQKQALLGSDAAEPLYKSELLSRDNALASAFAKKYDLSGADFSSGTVTFDGERLSNRGVGLLVSSAKGSRVVALAGGGFSIESGSGYTVDVLGGGAGAEAAFLPESKAVAITDSSGTHLISGASQIKPVSEGTFIVDGNSLSGFEYVVKEEKPGARVVYWVENADGITFSVSTKNKDSRFSFDGTALKVDNEMSVDYEDSSIGKRLRCESLGKAAITGGAGIIVSGRYAASFKDNGIELMTAAITKDQTICISCGKSLSDIEGDTLVWDGKTIKGRGTASIFLVKDSTREMCFLEGMHAGVEFESDGSTYANLLKMPSYQETKVGFRDSLASRIDSLKSRLRDESEASSLADRLSELSQREKLARSNIESDSSIDKARKKELISTLEAEFKSERNNLRDRHDLLVTALNKQIISASYLLKNFDSGKDEFASQSMLLVTNAKDNLADISVIDMKMQTGEPTLRTYKTSLFNPQVALNNGRQEPTQSGFNRFDFKIGGTAQYYLKGAATYTARDVPVVADSSVRLVSGDDMITLRGTIAKPIYESLARAGVPQVSLQSFNSEIDLATIKFGKDESGAPRSVTLSSDIGNANFPIQDSTLAKIGVFLTSGRSVKGKMQVEMADAAKYALASSDINAFLEMIQPHLERVGLGAIGQGLIAAKIELPYSKIDDLKKLGGMSLKIEKLDENTGRVSLTLKTPKDEASKNVEFKPIDVPIKVNGANIIDTGYAKLQIAARKQDPNLYDLFRYSQAASSQLLATQAAAGGGASTGLVAANSAAGTTSANAGSAGSTASTGGGSK